MDHPNAIDLKSVLAPVPAGKTGRDPDAGATLRFVLMCCAIPFAWTGAMLILAWAVRF